MLPATPSTLPPAIYQPGPSLDGGFAPRLIAPGPVPGEGSNRELYAPLIGDWEGEVVDRLPAGEVRQTAELHFAWVLGGRAVQDLWIVPAQREASSPAVPGAGPPRYGTTLRVYDPARDRWRVAWFNPLSGAENHLEGRHEGRQVVQVGVDPGAGAMRWTFDVIDQGAFHWKGEISADGGKTWICDTEFAAVRAAPRAPSPPAQAGRVLRWTWRDRLGVELLHLTRDGERRVARGTVSTAIDGLPVLASYELVHDADWRFLEARVRSSSASAAPRQRAIRQVAPGRWEVDGAARPELDGCEDVDLMISPYTNTPPIQARPLPAGGRRVLRVAWVRFPDLEVLPVSQAYGRPAEGSRYTYENLDSGFRGVISVDGEGLVTEYGPWLRR